MNPGYRRQLCLFLYFLPAITFSLSLSSCSLLLQNQVNKKFPKVSPTTRKVQNVVASSFNLTQIDTACVGVHLPTEKLSIALIDAIRTQRSFQINDADSIVIDTSGIHLAFEDQSIELQADAEVFISPQSSLKLLKRFRFHITGFVSPYFTDENNSIKTVLHLNPNVEALKISHIKFRNFFLNAVGPLAKYIVNDFSKRFIDNINGLIPDVQSELNLSFLYEKKYSELINSPEIIVSKDDEIVISKKLANKAILIRPSGLTVVSAIKEYVPAKSPLKIMSRNDKISALRDIVSRYKTINSKWSKHTDEEDIKKKTFQQLYQNYVVDFTRVWNTSLDSLQMVDVNKINTQISQKFLVSFANQLMNHPSFAFNLQQQDIPLHIERTRIELLKKPDWDCNQIEFHCDLNNCNNVLHDCGSCKWYDALCHVRWGICQATNGVAYTACQLLNGAKLGVCGVSYAAEKTYCFAKYAVLYAAHDLVSIGDVESDIKIAVSGSGNLGALNISSDLSQFALNTSGINGSGTFSGSIKYYKDWEIALTSILQCNCLGVYVPLPVGCTFPLPEMKGDFGFPSSITGTIEKVQDNVNKRAQLNITTREVPVAVEFKDQTPFEALLLDASLSLRCQMLFFGTALWGLAGNFFKFNDELQNKYNAIFKGLYTYTLTPKQFQLHLSPISLTLPNINQPMTLYSSWTNNTLTYKE